MMLNTLFAKAQDEFRIEGKELAQKVGCSPVIISDFRTGRRSVSLERFEKILLASEELRPGVIAYFCELMIENFAKYKKETIPDVSKLSDRSIGLLILAIAQEWESRKSIEKKELMVI